MFLCFLYGQVNEMKILPPFSEKLDISPQYCSEVATTLFTESLQVPQGYY